KLKATVRKEFGSEGHEAVAEMEQNMKKVDAIFDKIDKRLGESLTKAQSAKDPAGREAELKNSTKVIAEYMNYVESDALIAHIDSNPFGVKTNLIQVVTNSLKLMA